MAAGLVASRTNEDEALGLVSKGQTRKPDPHSKPRIDKSKLKCTHCGMMKHIKEQCFKLVGFPEWWNDGHKKGKTVGEEGGTATAAVGNPKVTGSSNDSSGHDSHQTTNYTGGFAAVALSDSQTGVHVQTSIRDEDILIPL